MNRLSQSTYNTLIIRSKKVFKSLILMRSMNVLITARSLTRSKISVNGSGLIIKKRLMNTGSKVVKEVTKHTPPVTPTIPKAPVVPAKSEESNQNISSSSKVQSKSPAPAPETETETDHPSNVSAIWKTHQEGQKVFNSLSKSTQMPKENSLTSESIEVASTNYTESDSKLQVSKSQDVNHNLEVKQSTSESKQQYAIDTDGSIMEVNSMSDTSRRESVQKYEIDTDGSIMEIDTPMPPPIPTYSTDHFKNQLKDAVAARKDRKVEIGTKLTSLDTESSQKALSAVDLEKKFIALAMRGLLDLEETKPKSKFYDYWIKEHTTATIEVSISNELQFNIGLLKIIDIDSTIILSGQQEHPIILCTSLDDKIIVWGYLTSEDQNDSTKAIELTKYQPFSGKKQNQYVRLVTPYVIQAQHIEDLPLDQRDNAKNYLIACEDKLIDIFQKKVIPKIEHGKLNLYDGTGITLANIDQVLLTFDKHTQEKAEEYLKKYKAKVNQGLLTAGWLKKINKVDKNTYERLLILIKDYENNKSI